MDEDFGRLPPLSLAYAAAIAEGAGHRVCLIDANVQKLSVDQVEQRLRLFKPDVLACTLSTYMFRETCAFLGELRARFNIPCVAGGINVRLFSVETLQNPAIDFGVVHFATRGLPLLLGALERGESPLGLPEVAAKDGQGNVVVGPVSHEENPFESLPRPARHLLQNEKYYSFISQRRHFTIMMTTTGCRYRCSFCAIASLPLHANPLDKVLAEVQECSARYGRA